MLCRFAAVFPALAASLIMTPIHCTTSRCVSPPYQSRLSSPHLCVVCLGHRRISSALRISSLVSRVTASYVYVIWIRTGLFSASPPRHRPIGCCPNSYCTTIVLHPMSLSHICNTHTHAICTSLPSIQVPFLIIRFSLRYCCC
ncbi:hypothetical protein C8Q76DRAFT_480485 [Earliella scabrosa]|nr:hypothetical protein C8Q76DRAFT_480485 [Earliella scabrosa]